MCNIPITPDGDYRFNLVFIAKILQKLANGELFGDESPHLKVFNTFILQNKEKLFDWLEELTRDPDQQVGNVPFCELETKFISYELIQTKTFEEKHLILIHRLIYDYSHDLIMYFQSENFSETIHLEKRTLSLFSSVADFLILVNDLAMTPP